MGNVEDTLLQPLKNSLVRALRRSVRCLPQPCIAAPTRRAPTRWPCCRWE